MYALYHCHQVTLLCNFIYMISCELLTIFQSAAVVVIFVWRFCQVHARVQVEACALGLSLSVPQDSAP